jgi:hypothetical protein
MFFAFGYAGYFRFVETVDLVLVMAFLVDHSLIALQFFTMGGLR